MILLTLILCLTPILIYWLYGVRTFIKVLNKIPGPKSHIIFGNVLDLSTKPDILFSQLRQLAKKYPIGYRLWGAHVGTVNLYRAEDIEVLISSMKHIEKSSIYDFIHPWLKTGLLTSTGKKWQQRRKILTPTFHFNILNRFLVIMNEHCQYFVTDIKAECEKPTNVTSMMSKHALNIICETAMGTRMDTMDEKQQRYRDSIYGLAPFLIQRTVKPWLYFNFIFNLSSLGRVQNKFLHTLHSFSRAVIEEREANFQKSDLENLEDEKIDICIKKKKRLAMLDLLISAKINGEIDDEGIREEVDTFMFEGHDTVSMALTFALMLFANHKDIQDKMVEELVGIFGDSGRLTTFEDLQNMKYIEMCLKESLRMYPSVPFISRTISEKIELEHFTVPKGSMAHIHIFDLHRDTKNFPNPEIFDPERFSPENCQGRHPFSYLPFSAGPRNCIGQKFAFMEMKCIVSSILRHFVLEPISTPEDVTLVIDIVLRSKSPIFIKFRPKEMC